MSDWRDVELQAAARTIDRMGRQLTIFREALERIEDVASDGSEIAAVALFKARKIDEELWKRIPKQGQVS